MNAQRTIAKEGALKYALSATDDCIDEIRPGETVTVECEINCNAGRITSVDSKLSPESVQLPVRQPGDGAAARRRRAARPSACSTHPEDGPRRGRLHCAVAGHRHVPGLGASARVRHPDAGDGGAQRLRALERRAQAADQADGRRARRGTDPRRGADRGQRGARRQPGRAGGRAGQHHPVRGAAEGCGPLCWRLPRPAGRRRMRRHGRHRDRCAGDAQRRACATSPSA